MQKALFILSLVLTTAAWGQSNPGLNALTECGVFAPTAFTLVGTMAAPEARARAVARATMLGYAGYFVGPPLVGMIAGSLGLRSAFVFTAALLGFVWLLAPLLVRLKPTRSV